MEGRNPASRIELRVYPYPHRMGHGVGRMPRTTLLASSLDTVLGTDSMRGRNGARAAPDDTQTQYASTPCCWSPGWAHRTRALFAEGARCLTLRILP